MIDTNKLSSVRTAFDSWRNGRLKRQSIPDELWQKAVHLLDDFPITLVAKELRLNTGHLRQKQFAFKRKEQQKSDIQEKTSFLELNQFLPVLNASSSVESAPVQLQIEKLDGTRLTLSLNSPQADMVQNLVTAFIRA